MLHKLIKYCILIEIKILYYYAFRIFSRTFSQLRLVYTRTTNTRLLILLLRNRALHC